MTNSIDTQITELFEVLNQKKKLVEESETKSKLKWKTNCSFPSVFGTTHPINIQTQTESALVELLSDLLIHIEYNKRAAALIGSKLNATMWGGFSVEDWVEDFATRIAKINLIKEQNELIELEKRLNAVVSPEQRRQLEVEALKTALSK